MTVLIQSAYGVEEREYSSAVEADIMTHSDVLELSDAAGETVAMLNMREVVGVET